MATAWRISASIAKLKRNGGTCILQISAVARWYTVPDDCLGGTSEPRLTSPTVDPSSRRPPRYLLQKVKLSVLAAIRCGVVNYNYLAAKLAHSQLSSAVR
jgi:hypothetical protein